MAKGPTCVAAGVFLPLGPPVRCGEPATVQITAYCSRGHEYAYIATSCARHADAIAKRLRHRRWCPICFWHDGRRWCWSRGTTERSQI